MTSQDKQELEQWLRQEGSLSAPSGERLLDCASQRLFQLRLELPAEAELQRLVNAALNGYFYDLYEQMTAQLPLKVQTQLDDSWSYLLMESFLLSRALRQSPPIQG